MTSVPMSPPRTFVGFDPQRVLPGFEHVRRFWDPAQDCVTVKILPGEFYVSAQQEMVSTVLGSCVSACVRDKRRGIGGMNHFMLPEPTGPRDGWTATVSRLTLDTSKRVPVPNMVRLHSHGIACRQT